MPLVLTMPETRDRYSQGEDSIRGPRDPLSPLCGHNICLSFFSKGKD